MIKEGPFVHFEGLVAPMNLKEDGGYLTRVFLKENGEKTEKMKTNETTSEDHFFYKWFISKEITWKPGFTISQPIIHFMQSCCLNLPKEIKCKKVMKEMAHSFWT